MARLLLLRRQEMRRVRMRGVHLHLHAQAGRGLHAAGWPVKLVRLPAAACTAYWCLSLLLLAVAESTYIMNNQSPLSVLFASAATPAGLLTVAGTSCAVAWWCMHACTQVIRGFTGRLRLPAVTLMWNASSPHGPPVALNAMHDAMLHAATAPRPSRARGQAKPTNASVHAGQAAHAAGRALHGANKLEPKDATNHLASPPFQAGPTSSPSMAGASSSSASTPPAVRFSLQAASQPLPPQSLVSRASFDLMRYILVSLLVSVPLMYSCGTLVLQVVSERASGAAAAQVLAGVPRGLLWASHALWDIGTFWALSVAIVALLWLGDVQSLTGACAVDALKWRACLLTQCHKLCACMQGAKPCACAGAQGHGSAWARRWRCCWRMA